MNNSDLTTVRGMKNYVSNGVFASNHIVPIPDGSANHIFRLHLREPYNNRQTVIVKHADARSLLQRYEVHAMRDIRAWFSDSLVTAPEIYLFDDTNKVIIMEDCGEYHLKQLLQLKMISISTARTIGTALGGFLAQLYIKVNRNKQVLEHYNGNEHARVITLFIYYGRLAATLSEDPSLPTLLNPSLGISAQDIMSISQLEKSVSQEIQIARETLLMGDFWPGNIVPALRLNGTECTVERIYVLDWERVQPGLRGMDIGHFCAEVHQARMSHPSCHDLAEAILSAFLQAYRKDSCGDLIAVAQMAMIHVGAHLVSLAPRVKWGGKDKTREIVMEGVRYLIEGSNGSRENIAASIVGGLLIDNGT